MAAVADDVDSLDDVWMLESGADTKFGSDLLLVFLLGLARSFGSKLFNGEDVGIMFSFNQPDSAARA